MSAGMEYRVRTIIEERRVSDRLRPNGRPYRSRFVKVTAWSSTPTDDVSDAWDLYEDLSTTLRARDARRS